MDVKTTKIYFITGALFHNSYWDDWINFFVKRGIQCTAPIWPFKTASVDSLYQRHPDYNLGGLTIEDIVLYYTSLIQAQPNEFKPILVGHSLGGLIVQILLQKGIGLAGIAIQSFPPYGLNTLNFTYLYTIISAIDFQFHNRSPFIMSYKNWKSYITNGFEEITQKRLYQTYLTPESRRLFRSTFTENARINYNLKRVPLLLIAGGNDRMTPAALNYQNYKRYKNNSTHTEYIEFAEIPHFSIICKEWEEIAMYVYNWIYSL